MTCNSLDHVYPSTVLGTPCYCGKRTWGGVKATVVIVKRSLTRRLLPGQRVRVMGELRSIVTKLRGEDCYRIDVAVGTRTLFERSELEVVK